MTLQAVKLDFPRDPVLQHGKGAQRIHRVIMIDPETRTIIAEYDYKGESEFERDHFPGNLVYPGIYHPEAAAQAAGQIVQVEPSLRDRFLMLGGIEEAKFRKLVRPPATIRYECRFIKFNTWGARATFKATVGGLLVADGILTFITAKSQ